MSAATHRFVASKAEIYIDTLISCREAHTFYKCSGWHSADQKAKRKSYKCGLTQFGKIPLSFSLLVGKDLETIGDELLACLREGLCVKLQGLGTIGTYTRKGRVLEHNAIVGGRCESQDKAVVKLVPSQKLNASLRGVKV